MTGVVVEGLVVEPLGFGVLELGFGVLELVEALALADAATMSATSPPPMMKGRAFIGSLSKERDP